MQKASTQYMEDNPSIIFVSGVEWTEPSPLVRNLSRHLFQVMRYAEIPVSNLLSMWIDKEFNSLAHVPWLINYLY